MAALFKNFAESTVEEYFDVGDTSLVIHSNDTSKFPSGIGSDHFLITLFDGENDPEICKVTAVSGATFTVVRAQESSNSRAWEIGSYVRLAATAGQAEAMFAGLEDHESRLDVLEAQNLEDITGDFLFCHAMLGS